jgi:hypothetical protein
MAWTKDNELHLVNLSSLLKMEPEIMIDKWRNGVKLAIQKKHTDFADICIYESVTRLFDTLYIEVHPPLEEKQQDPSVLVETAADLIYTINQQRPLVLDRQALREALEKQNGMPVAIGQSVHD